MNQERINYLLKAYQAQTATQAEKTEFSEILHDKNYESLFHKLFDKQWDELNKPETDKLEIADYDRILQEIKQQPRIVNSSINWWSRIAVAAAILIVAFGAARYFFTKKDINPETYFANDIAPGKNGATLTLANGRKILINDALAGNIVTESGVKITKNKDGQLIYEIIESNDGPLGYNTLSTTRGEQTQVRLQDGTVVFLNAESSLKYPTSFTKTIKREVTLTGEAYFEVAKDKQHPFVVNADQQSVEVLGTTFNINSYPDEPEIKTTLLEGSVKISNLTSHLSSLLKPGEQATIGGLNLDIKNIEVDDVVAWKNGYIMKKVSRWYNVEVFFKEDALKRKTFFGSVSRFDNVSELLKLLQNTGAVKFEINGRQINVSQKK
jgi:transmembrane sensor